MEIKYLGPSDAVNIAPFGSHRKDEVKSYPDVFAKDLLATSKKQRFQAIDEPDSEQEETPVETQEEMEAPAPPSPIEEKDRNVVIADLKKARTARIVEWLEQNYASADPAFIRTALKRHKQLTGDDWQGRVWGFDIKGQVKTGKTG